MGGGVQLHSGASLLESWPGLLSHKKDLPTWVKVGTSYWFLQGLPRESRKYSPESNASLHDSPCYSVGFV